MKPVLITGATGFLGQYVVELLRAEGVALRLLARGATRWDGGAGVEVLRGDVTVAADETRDVRSVAVSGAGGVVGLKHRYGYMLGLPGSSDTADPMDASGSILKYDRATGGSVQLGVGRGRMPGEPVFVPAADATSEDDGYLMTFVYDAESHTSRFVIFDAKTMDATPVASVQLPRVPSGFHGSWIPSSVAN